MHCSLTQKERAEFIRHDIVDIFVWSYGFIGFDSDVECPPGFYNRIYADLALLWQKLIAPEKLVFIKNLSRGLHYLNEELRERAYVSIVKLTYELSAPEAIGFIMMLNEHLSSFNKQQAVDLVSRLYKLDNIDCEISKTLLERQIPAAISELVMTYVR